MIATIAHSWAGRAQYTDTEYEKMGDRGGCQKERAKMQISDIVTVILLLYVTGTTKRVPAECRWYIFPFVVNGVGEDIGS
jgi:hypothetical protein